MIKVLKSSIKRLIRRGLELLGVEKYSHPSLNELDKKILKYLPTQSGVFIEVGANNGYSQSNTYYLERFQNWRGVLIEPIPALYKECIKERKNSKIFNCALVANDYEKDYVEIYNVSLMSVIDGVMNREDEEQHLQNAIKCEKDLKVELIKVPVRTLTSILEECNIEKIDFFSLDVEGYELEALKGLDFDKFAPKFILVEANKRKELDSFLLNKYDIIEEFSNDVLYKKK